MAVQKQLLKGVLAGALALMLSGCVTIPDAIKGSSPMPQQDLVRVMKCAAAVCRTGSAFRRQSGGYSEPAGKIPSGNCHRSAR